MSQIILDFGSGNTCRNDWPIAKRMLDELQAVDSGRHEVIIKWQLFKEAGDNIPLDRELFKRAFDYASKMGYQTTASVFDKDSLEYLLKFNVSFVKIANRRSLGWLIGEIPRKVPVYVSYGNTDELKAAPRDNIQRLLCVSRYPATIEDYEDAFDLTYYIFGCNYGISDHTTDFKLWKTYRPPIVEWHLKLNDSTGPDAGPFARTPKMLEGVL